MDLAPLLPEILLVTLAIGVLFMDWVLPTSKKQFLAYAGIIGIAILYGWMYFNHPISSNLVMTLDGGQKVFQGFVLDGVALFFKKLFLIAVMLVFVFSLVFRRDDAENTGEYYALLLFVTLGAFFLVSASDLLMVFVSFELMSIPLYLLCGFRKGDSRSNEAGLKYFLIGAVTSAVLVYGISLVYASLGTTDLRHLVSPGPVTLTRLSEDPVLMIGLLFIMSALAFKVAAVPFHMWAPDVVEGAPTPVAAFLAVVPKIAVIGLIVRVFIGGMPEAMNLWSLIFAILAALSMTVGNLLALHQENLKRLLAYSGISQVGYILLGLAAIGPVGLSSPPFLQLGFQAVFFYVVVYLFSDLAAFGVVTLLTANHQETVASCRGLSVRSPALSLVFLIALLSLAGIPPLAGFAGKVYLFAAAFSRGLYWLVALGVVNSVISLFYYLRIAKAMYVDEKSSESKPTFVEAPMRVALAVAALGIVMIGIFPRLIVDTAQSALQRFLAAF